MKRIFGFGAATALGRFASALPGSATRPNILLAISDDQSFEHVSALGYRAVSTPAFDRVAAEGVLFRNAIAASPGCAPSRASLLTGRYPWQNEQAGTHASEFPRKFAVYPDILEEAGYFVGMTGKGAGPCNYKIEGWERNPAGPVFDKKKTQPPFKGIGGNDYAANFADFLAQRSPDRPFCFWFGASEPHRSYQKGSGLEQGKRIADADPPSFLPDHDVVRSDILDYCVEIEWFDSHLGRMLDLLEQTGELENTLVVVTADNGMPFPRAKANCYEYGVHVPLAIRWAGRAPAGRIVDDPVSFVDLAPTFLEAAGIADVNNSRSPLPMAGRSLVALLESGEQGVVEPERDAVFAARERHSSSRWNNLGYPQRCLRTRQHLYIRNFKPERWPAGDPRPLKEDGSLEPESGGYCDIDDGPTKTLLVENRAEREIGRYFELATARRPSEELFDVLADPGCLRDLARDAAHAETLAALRGRMDAFLRETADPRSTGEGYIWETYKRYSPIRQFPMPDGADRPGY